MASFGMFAHIVDLKSGAGSIRQVNFITDTKETQRVKDDRFCVKCRKDINKDI